MEVLSLKSIIKKGKYANKIVSEIVNVKGAIFSLIKEGYIFDDEVLMAAKIKKNISNIKTVYSFNKNEKPKNEKLPKETASIKQILSEINTITYEKDFGKNNGFENYDNSGETIIINVLDEV